MRRRFATFSFITLLIALGAGGLAQESVKLDLKFNPGEVSRYKMIVDINLSLDASGPSSLQIPNLPMGIVVVMRQRTKRVLPNGDAEINAVVESLKMTMGNKTQQAPVNKIPVMTMVMSPKGEVKSMKGFENFTGACGGMDFVNPWNPGQYGALPSTELLVGESWSQSVPFPMGGNVQVIGMLLSANEMLGKTSCAVIKQDIYGDLSFDKPLPGYNGQNISLPPGLKMKGRINGTGTTYFSTQQGRIIRSEGNADIQMSVGGQVQGANGGSPASAVMSMRMAYQLYLVPSK